MRHLIRSLFFIILTVSAVNSRAAEPNVLRLATTTSTDNSGLLRSLLPAFEQLTHYKVHVIAVGTGKALRMGRDGDVDVVLVHAPAAEKQFVAEGHGVNHREVMYNDFIVVGPKSDPAGILGITDAGAALAKLAEQRASFVSRGDDSGTHKKERALWQAAGIRPAGTWYREAGQGMGRVLQIASELDAYTLCDRGTWLAMRDKLPLAVLVEGDTRLFNPYGIIAVNPARYPEVNYLGAMTLIAWMTSTNGQAMIQNFKIGGEALFSPLAISRNQRDGIAVNRLQ